MNKSITVFFFLGAAVLAGLVLGFPILTSHDRTVLLNTLWLGIGASIIAIPCGMIACYLLRFRSAFSALLLATLVGMLAMPLVLHASSWDSAFGKLGWLTARQGEILTPLISGWTAAIWIHGIAAIPFTTLIFLLSEFLERRTFEEQASLDAGGLSLFFKIRVPRLVPLFITSFGWVCLTCARTIAVTDLFQVSTLAEQIYLGYSMGQLAPGTAWTMDDIRRAENMSLLVTILTIGIFTLLAISVFVRFQSEFCKIESRTRALPKFLNVEPNGLSRLGSLILMLTFFLVPFANLLTRASFEVVPTPDGPFASYQLANIWEAISRAVSSEGDVFVWSALIATTSSLSILILGTIGGWLARHSRLWLWGMTFSIVVPFSIPGPLWSNFYAWLLGNSPMFDWLYNYTIFAPTLANFTFCWPLGCLLVWFIMANVESETLESAQLDGAGLLMQWWNLGILQNSRSLFGAWLVLFPICFGELSASRMVLPAGMQTLPGTVLGFMHAGVDEMTAALTLITGGGLVLISGFGWSLLFASSNGLGQNKSGH